MAKVWINAWSGIKPDDLGATPQVAPGFCSQDRVEIASLPANFPAQPQMTFADGTGICGFEGDDARIKFWSGPPSVTDAIKQARAQVVSMPWQFYGSPGHVVHVWAAT